MSHTEVGVGTGAGCRLEGQRLRGAQPRSAGRHTVSQVAPRVSEPFCRLLQPLSPQPQPRNPGEGSQSCTAVPSKQLNHLAIKGDPPAEATAKADFPHPTGTPQVTGLTLRYSSSCQGGSTQSRPGAGGNTEQRGCGRGPSLLSYPRLAPGDGTDFQGD